MLRIGCKKLVKRAVRISKLTLPPAGSEPEFIYGSRITQKNDLLA